MDNGRAFNVEAAVIANGGHTSGAVDIRQHASGSVFTPAALTAADLSFMVCDTEDGTYVQCRTDDTTMVKIDGPATGAANAYAIPSTVFAHGWMKLRSTNVGSEANVAQAAERIFSVALKG